MRMETRKSDLESSQHAGSEEDPLLAPNLSRHSKHSKHSRRSHRSSASNFGVCPDWKSKQNRILLGCGLGFAALVAFVHAVKSQVEDQASLHMIIAANALKRLNDNIQYLPPKKCTVTVLIARHCNDYGFYAKDDAESGDKHCSYVGYERTRYFASRFGGSHDETQHQQQQHRWPSPIGLYALLPKQPQGINYRQIETLLPLAKQSNISIQIVGEPSHVASSIFEQLQTMNHDPIESTDNQTETNNFHDDDDDDGDDGDGGDDDDAYCGQVFVVAWKHAFISDVAAALGCGPKQGCPTTYPDGEFDLIWQLRFVHEPPAPEDEVPWLVDQQSSLIVDNYHLLSKQQRQEDEQDQVDADASNDFNRSLDHQANDRPYRHKSQNPGWVVYGTVTNQNFDPLHASHKQQTNLEAREEL